MSIRLLHCTVVHVLYLLFGLSRWRYLIEFVIIVLPLLSAMTLAADYSIHVTVILTLVSTLLLGFTLHHKNIQNTSCLRMQFPEKYPFVSGYRAYVNIATAIAILAVDFNIFPRRFAKTETYGVSVMDVGVGAYVFANGIVSAEARRPLNLHVVNHVVQTSWACLVMVALGFVRLLLLKATDYHEHVTEYGVHWNFFFTLAAVKLISSIVIPLIPSAMPLAAALMGCVVVLAYQYALSVVGLNDYVMYGPHGDGSRSNVIHANREGLLSCVGYLAIYLFSVELGRFLFRKRYDTLIRACRLLYVSHMITSVWSVVVHPTSPFLLLCLPSAANYSGRKKSDKERSMGGASSDIIIAPIETHPQAPYSCRI